MGSKQSEIEAALGFGQTKRRWPRWGLALLVLATLGGAIWYWGFEKPSENRVQYRTEAARRGNLQVIVNATGSIAPTNLVEISSELSGTLKTVLVDYNDLVEKGDVLASLDTEKLEAMLDVQTAAAGAAKARVLRAEATLLEAAEKYERLRQLDMRGVTTHTEFTAAKAVYLRAQADASIAKADLSLAEANLALQTAELQKACICSPIKGVVLKRAAEVGQIVASSLSAPILFTIAEDLTKMELQVDIDEADIGRISLGDPAEFTVEAYENRRFPARITHIRYASETIDGVVTYKALLDIENADLALRPGMTATTEVTVASLQDVLLVPNAALRFAPPQSVAEDDREGGSGLLGMIFSGAPRDTSTAQSLQKSVWVLSDGMAREVLVTTGATNGLLTEIIDGDLKPEDLVITDQFEAG